MSTKEKLCARADEIREQLQAVEDFFAEKFAVPAFVSMENGLELGFRKVGNDWAIVAQPAYGGMTPGKIKDLSLLRRLEVAERIRELYRALVEAQREALERSERVALDLSSFCRELGAG